MKDAFYFSHDSNARNDERILMLRAEHGWEGYGIFWALIEMMFENSETSLSHNKIKGIAVSYNIDITLLQSVINTCLTEELFTSDGDSFWSESLRKRKGKYHEFKTKKSEAGKKGMAKRWASDNSVITEIYQGDNSVITKDNKGKESKVKESIYSAEEIINYLNLKSGTNYKPNSTKTKNLIEARHKESFTLEDFKKVIDIKVNEWKGTDMQKYLRPETLFGTKFESYLNQSLNGKKVKQDNDIQRLLEQTGICGGD